MSKRHDNTSRASEFICLRCLSKNQVGDKIRRPNMREKWKDYDITLKKDELLFLDMITNK